MLGASVRRSRVANSRDQSVEAIDDADGAVGVDDYQEFSVECILS